MDEVVGKTTVTPRIAWLLGSASAFIAIVIALIGVGGLTGAFALTSLNQRLLQHVLVDLTPTDTLSLLTAIGIVVVFVCLAAYLPARRVFHVQPATLLTRTQF